MKSEELFFLQLLGDYVHGDKSTPPKDEMDWERVVALAKSQSLAGVVFFQCRDFLEQNSKTYGALFAEFVNDVFHYTCRESDFLEVSNALSEAGVSFVPVKGMTLAEYHPVPQLRSMGDIDLVIMPKDRKTSHAVMEGLGFHYFVDNHAVWTYSRDVVHYEIHDHLMYDPLANRFDYRTYFDCVWEHAVRTEGTRYEIEPNFHFLYLISHTAKHIVNYGCGVRAFLDMVFLIQKEKLDWVWIRSELEKLRLLDFTDTCFALCERWFGVNMPLATRELSESFYEDATAKILHDGTFGLQNSENITGKSTREVKRLSCPYWITALILTLRRLFPPYRDLQLIPQYAFIDGRPWLLPFAWIYRFIYCAVVKPSHSKRLLEQPFTMRKQIERREEFISNWGL